MPPDDAGLGTSPSDIASSERRWQWRAGAERWSSLGLLAASQPGVAVLWGSIELLAPAGRRERWMSENDRWDLFVSWKKRNPIYSACWSGRPYLGEQLQ